MSGARRRSLLPSVLISNTLSAFPNYGFQMKKDPLMQVLEYVGPLLAGAIVGAAVHFLKLAQQNNEIIIVTVSAAIAGYLVADKFFLNDRLSNLEAAISNVGEQNVSVETLSVKEALASISREAAHCANIKNTRFRGNLSTGAEANFWKQRIAEFDKAIAAAVGAGTGYTLVVDAEGAKQAQDMMRTVQGIKGDTGRVSFHRLRSSMVQVPQLTILDFHDGGRKVYVGWENDSHSVEDAKVYAYQAKKPSKELLGSFVEMFQGYLGASAFIEAREAQSLS